MNKEKITGQLGTIYDQNKELVPYTFRELESGKSVINFRLKTTTEWVTCAAWDSQAERMKEAIDNQFKKFSFEGMFKTKETNDKQYTYFNVHDFIKMKAIQIEGKITSLRDKTVKLQTGVEKTIKEALVTHADQTYKVDIWPEVNLGSKTALENGSKIYVNGEGTHLRGKDGEFISIKAYDIARTKNQLAQIMKSKENQPAQSIES